MFQSLSMLDTTAAMSEALMSPAMKVKMSPDPSSNRRKTREAAQLLEEVVCEAFIFTQYIVYITGCNMENGGASHCPGLLVNRLRD